MARGNLDLAVARLTRFKAAERLRLLLALETEADFASLSRADAERVADRRIAEEDWNPGRLLSLAAADRTACLRFGIDFVSWISGDYPPLLREIPDAPTVLFYRGRASDPERPLVAVVGTRDPSSAAAASAFDFGRGFGECGIPVVSGLARGIDSLAHRGNLDAGAPTVAVLASGLDGVYPASNRPLAHRILAAGGLLLSEYPPGESPRKWHFPARNRIIAGLARATVVVEAPAGSGALITADFAVDQGRDLWVARAGVESARGEGTRRLAGEGAPVAEDASDIAADWGFAPGIRQPRRDAGAKVRVFRGSSAARGRSLADELAHILELELL